jgi:hypothetical protein
MWFIVGLIFSPDLLRHHVVAILILENYKVFWGD